jgi:hypothetical protein
VKPADLARVLKHVPRDTDRLSDIGGLHRDGDAEAKTVPTAAKFGYKVGGKDGRDHLVAQTLVELGDDPVPRATARVSYLEIDRERLIRHLSRLLAAQRRARRRVCSRVRQMISESGRPTSTAVIDAELRAGPCDSGVRDHTPVLVMLIAATAAISLARYGRDPQLT